MKPLALSSRHFLAAGWATRSWAVCAGALAALPILAAAAEPVAPAVAVEPARAGASAAPLAPSLQARYLRERTGCLEGRSNQDQATCLKEAGAAHDAALRGQLDTGGTDYHRNAALRCDALRDADASDCRARIHGAGTTTGSARDGGIYRELVTREVPALPAAPASAASAP